MRDYPRVCGGTSLTEVLGTLGVGLSPRVRGNPQVAPHHARAHRTIPACAGEPAYRNDDYGAGRDYPRVCGGTHRDLATCPVNGGLSPRVRGNQKTAPYVDLYKGTIPACAGEPGASGSAREGEKDYPRVCGGTNADGIAYSKATGLSPRVRGNPVIHMGGSNG